MPVGAKLGASVPLKTPVTEPGKRDERMEPPEKRNFQRPKGRILIFWGCGEHAPAGQPIDHRLYQDRRRADAAGAVDQRCADGALSQPSQQQDLWFVAER